MRRGQSINQRSIFSKGYRPAYDTCHIGYRHNGPGLRKATRKTSGYYREGPTKRKWPFLDGAEGGT